MIFPNEMHKEGLLSIFHERSESFIITTNSLAKGNLLFQTIICIWDYSSSF